MNGFEQELDIMKFLFNKSICLLNALKGKKSGGYCLDPGNKNIDREK